MNSNFLVAVNAEAIGAREAISATDDFRQATAVKRLEMLFDRLDVAVLETDVDERKELDLESLANAAIRIAALASLLHEQAVKMSPSRRPASVPSREEIYELLKSRSDELQS